MGGALRPEWDVFGENHPERRGYSALRQFRDSRPAADYFITTNLEDRGWGLDENGLTKRIWQQLEKLETESRWKVRTAVVMPDHVHLLVTLTTGQSLGECIRLFKGPLTPELRIHALHWQDGFYDHRIRGPSDLLPVFLYIFLNPYRAGLIKGSVRWPGYYCRPEDWIWFKEMTRESVPQLEWLR